MNGLDAFPGLDPVNAAIAAYLVGDLAGVQHVYAPLTACLNAMLGDVSDDDGEDSTLMAPSSR